MTSPEPTPDQTFPPDHPTGHSLHGWRLYLVGLWVGQRSDGTPIWEFVSLEESRAAADAACPTRQHFFVEVRIGERAPEDSSIWPGVVYPRQTAQ